MISAIVCDQKFNCDLIRWLVRANIHQYPYFCNVFKKSGRPKDM